MMEKRRVDCLYGRDVRVCAIFVSLFLFFGGLSARAEDMIVNGGFEVDSDGDGMADHWTFAGDSGMSAKTERAAGFKGRFSQKLACARFETLGPSSHVMLAQLNTLRLEKGKWYRIAFAARHEGIPGGVVNVATSETGTWTNCGLRESFQTGAAWKELAFTFQASRTVSGHVRLQFWYTSTGTLWLDEVSLAPAEAVVKRYTDVLAETASVNLIPNGSFECGAAGWGSVTELPGWDNNLDRLVGETDDTGGRLGRSSFKIALRPETLPIYYFDYYAIYRVPVKAPLLANRGWISVEKGQPYTLSAYMRADRDDLAAVLSCRQAAGGILKKTVRLKTGWDRYEFTFRPRANQVFAAMGADLEASGRAMGTVWIDGVQLEKGSAATDYAARSDVEIGLGTNQSGNLFEYGSHPEVTARIFNRHEAARTLTVGIRTTDFDDKVVHETQIPVAAAALGMTTVLIPCGVARRGFYRLHIACLQAEVVPQQSLRFAIIEPYGRKDSLFGMNHAYPWPHLLDLSRQIGLCWFRDWSLKRQDVEPEKGVFRFDKADEQIDRVLERGLNVLPLLPFPSSHWASSAETPAGGDDYMTEMNRVSSMPRKLEDFASYVAGTVEHYRDRLKYWEILNEPYYTFYALPQNKGYQVKDYVRLLKAAYGAMKQVDGDGVVIGGIAGNPDRHTKEFIDAGGLQWVDIMNLHTYPGLTPPEAYDEPLRQLRQRMREAGGDKPIWFTEGAYYADDDPAYEPFDSDWLTPLAAEAMAAE